MSRESKHLRSDLAWSDASRIRVQGLNLMTARLEQPDMDDSPSSRSSGGYRLPESQSCSKTHLADAFGLSEQYPCQRHFRDVQGESFGYGGAGTEKRLIARESLTVRD